MLTIIWDPENFYVVDVKNDGTPFNSEYFCNHIIGVLAANYL
jgi:hypothetical protein